MDPFITVEDLGAKMHRDLSSDDAAVICVDAACDFIRDLTGQTINLVTDDALSIDGTGTDALLLPEAPVVAVSAVTVNGDTIPTGSYGVKHEMLIRKDLGYWTLGRLNVVVTYDHGWDEDTLPRSLKMVALSIAERMFTQGSGIVYQSLGQYAVRYSDVATALTLTEQTILRKHTRKP
jgi:hypothetical protein